MCVNLCVSYWGGGPKAALGQDELCGSSHFSYVSGRLPIWVTGRGLVSTTVLVHTEQGVNQHCLRWTARRTLHPWKIEYQIYHLTISWQNRYKSDHDYFYYLWLFLDYKGTLSLFHVILITMRTRLRPLKAVNIGASILLHQSIQRHLS